MDRTEQTRLTHIIAEELSHQILLHRNLTAKDAYDLCKQMAEKYGVKDSREIDTLAFDAVIEVSMMPIHKSNLHEVEEYDETKV
jgi:hypothetical protein